MLNMDDLIDFSRSSSPLSIRRNKGSGSNSSSNSRGSESPMEIDSPPPLWLKPLESNSSSSQSLNMAGNKRNDRSTSNCGNSHENNNKQLDTNTKNSVVLANSLFSPINPKESKCISSCNSLNSVNSVSSVGSVSSINSTNSVNSCKLDQVNFKSPLRQVHTITSPKTIATSFSFSPSFPPVIFRSLNAKKLKKRPTCSRSDDPQIQTVAHQPVNSTISNTSFHLYLPIILMNYFQLVFNSIIGFGFLFLVYTAVKTIMHDSQLKVEERLLVMNAEISLCARQYQENRCAPQFRVPAMEKACIEWEACMSKDPSITSRARLHAETIAEILNSFFGSISTKSFLCMIIGVVAFMVIFNVAFYFGREKRNFYQTHQFPNSDDFASNPSIHHRLPNSLNSFSPSPSPSPLSSKSLLNSPSLRATTASNHRQF